MNELMLIPMNDTICAIKTTVTIIRLEVIEAIKEDIRELGHHSNVKDGQVILFL